jgi:hypothetical protein
VELTDRIIPSRGFTRSGPGRPPDVTDAELVCLAVVQVLMRFDDERHWLCAAPKLAGHLFPRLDRQWVHRAVKAAALLMEAALAGCLHASYRGDAAPDERHARGVRPVRRHGPALGPVRPGRVRVLPQPLGSQAAAVLAGGIPSPPSPADAASAATSTPLPPTA